jgi:phosphonate degradation associated HDIG domain protein
MSSLAHLTLETIRQLFATAGERLYGGEAVSQREHALQAAWLAEQDGQPDSMVAACLLHDLGHLLFDQDDSMLEQGRDDMHQSRIIPYLVPLFPDEVAAPIGMHVDAKRYLCSVQPDYYAALSDSSRTSLLLQGGVMGMEEAGRFASAAYADQAIALRRYDDAAKVVGMATPGFDYFLPRLQALVERAAA